MAGQETFRLCELLQWIVYCYQGTRTMSTDPFVPYYGSLLDNCTLVPEGAMRGDTQFRDWLDVYLSSAVRRPKSITASPWLTSPNGAQAASISHAINGTRNEEECE